jgi:rod shape determining protein RodA
LRRRNNNIFKGVDLVLILFYLIFIFLGWLSIYAATYTEGQVLNFNLATPYGKQAFFIGFSFLLIFVILLIDRQFYEKYSGIFYVISMLSLAGLFIFGKNINGASSWYGFGNFSLQPSEFAKAATALALANYLSERGIDLRKLPVQLRAFGIIFLPAFLITLQPDPGSALVYIFLFLVLYRFGLPQYYLIIGSLSIVLFLLTLYIGYFYTIIISFVLISVFFIYIYKYNKLVFRRNWMRLIVIYFVSGLFIFSVDYIFNNVFEQRHRDRFDILLGKKSDSKGIGYNTSQSIMTIASGGFIGKGYLQGDRTQGDFVPEQQTDYIFSTIGEEWGFVGSALVVLLFVLFITRILYIAERQKSQFSKVYAYTVAIIFFFHFMINVGMVIGLLPTVGIPLPFFSYGGSSLWGFTLLLFILIRLDADRIYEW